MRQVIIVLIALLAISIFMPAIMAKQGNTQPVLASITNLSKVTMPKTDPETTLPFASKSIKDFINGTPLQANYKDVIDNNNAARSSILNFLAPDWSPSTSITFPTPTPTYKLHQMS